jgi:hypothetical protein
MGTELEGRELDEWDFGNPFDSGLSAQESEARMMAQLNVEGLQILSTIGSFFDSLFVSAEAKVSQDISDKDSSGKVTAETAANIEIGFNLGDFFSNYSMNDDGTANFHSAPFTIETSVTELTSVSMSKTVKINPILDFTGTGSIKTNTSTGETTLNGRGTIGVNDNGLFVSGSYNTSTSSSNYSAGLRTEVKTP